MCLMTGKHDMSSERITGPAAGRYNGLPMKGAFNVTCQMTEGNRIVHAVWLCPGLEVGIGVRPARDGIDAAFV